jgi:phosphatidylserine decarboxylase
MEVGATLVGRIINHEEEAQVKRGDEKGFFEYGGSTIILLLQKDKVKINPELLENSGHGIESPVKMGQVIGAI